MAEMNLHENTEIQYQNKVEVQPVTAVLTDRIESPVLDPDLLDALMNTLVFSWARANPTAVTESALVGLITNILVTVGDSEEGQRAATQLAGSAWPHFEPDVLVRAVSVAVEGFRANGPWTSVRFASAGVPQDFCFGKGSPVDSARHDLRRRRAADAGRYLFDADDNRWLIRGDDGEWAGRYTDAALSQMLEQEGIPEKLVPSVKAGARHVHGKRPVYGSAEKIVNVNGFDVLNTYRPPLVKAVPGDWSMYADLIRNLTNGDRQGEAFVLDWTAAPLQSLHRNTRPLKMQTALVFYGIPGSGKGTFERALAALYGESNVVVIGQSALDAHFNGELIGKLMVVANEVISSSNRYAETSNKLKTWITDSKIPLERKYKDLTVVDNGFNLIFTSNDDRPVLIERGDRRYVVFKSEQKLPESVVKAIYADLNGDQRGISAFFAHLLEREVKVKPGQLYETAARRELQEESLPSDELFARELAALGWDGAAGIWRDSVHWTSGRGDVFQVAGKCWIRSDDIMDAYRSWCHRHEKRARGWQSLSRALKRAVPTAENGRAFDGRRTVRAWSGLPEGDKDASSWPPEVWLGEVSSRMLN